MVRGSNSMTADKSQCRSFLLGLQCFIGTKSRGRESWCFKLAYWYLCAGSLRTGLGEATRAEFTGASLSQNSAELAFTANLNESSRVTPPAYGTWFVYVVSDFIFPPASPLKKNPYSFWDWLVIGRGSGSGSKVVTSQGRCLCLKEESYRKEPQMIQGWKRNTDVFLFL